MSLPVLIGIDIDTATELANSAAAFFEHEKGQFRAFFLQLGPFGVLPQLLLDQLAASGLERIYLVKVSQLQSIECILQRKTVVTGKN
jgi:hypothetical protein